ncbi:hypothetical protein [Dyadobacter sp. 3J3]|uniref:hypothetical protein n=1 Tax=Dyadobacter sp. 3J3 TaxID=2606600 RepID=UPI001359AF9E|nr:hypothetical protein [Dyadobacter sp. 3J3]
MEETEFDPLLAEKKELDIINNNGMFFTVTKRFTGWFSKSKTRSFTITSFPLGVMDRLSGEYINLDLDEELININPLHEVKNLTKAHAYRCAKIVAIAWLNNSPFYPFLVNFLAGYFFMRITPKQLLQLTTIINTMANYGDFTNSIRYLRTARTTKPQLIETNSED